MNVRIRKKMRSRKKMYVRKKGQRMQLKGKVRPRANSVVWPEWFRMALFSKLEQVLTKLKPCRFDNNSSNNFSNLDPRFRAYEPLPHMKNIDLSAESGLKLIANIRS
ncbi:hypothetical protein J1N35_013743 [Gossypium stocksii]|uniref:Uncharacterized protein n=1 Tax=Gossypium stocksii TaxID=47602 RepID=A0A9D3VT81_9ROSI|nr:hypothetical protein J1N35_013743 [Gossypium stocksii]